MPVELSGARDVAGARVDRLGLAEVPLGGARVEQPPARLGDRGGREQRTDRERVEVGDIASMDEILFGPSKVADGTTNIVGALKRAMATTGYSDLKEFQRVEVVVAPYQRS